MRSGDLRCHATVLAFGADLLAVDLGRIWIDIKAKEQADPPAPTGLRTPARIDIRARFSERLIQGRYIAHRARLFCITSARDPVGDRAELRITADELVGEVAEYRPRGCLPVACRVHLTHSAPYLDDMGQVTDYKIRAEVALIEVGRPQVDDQLLVSGVLYNVIQYAADSDDGVVRGLWLEQVA